MATTLEVRVEDEHFKATGRTPLVEGWRVLYGGSATIKKKKADDADSDEQEFLPDVNVGDMGRAAPIDLIAKSTPPPKRFTAITLLAAMEKAHQFVTDPKIKAKLREVEGIGTEATRAGIISRAVSTGFILEDKTNKVITYIPTPKAFSYIMSIPETLTKPDLTAWFEGKLDNISKGALDYASYRTMLAKLVNHVIEPAKSGQAYQRMPTPEQMPAQVERKTPKAPKAPAARKTGLARKRSAAHQSPTP